MVIKECAKLMIMSAALVGQTIAKAVNFVTKPVTKLFKRKDKTEGNKVEEQETKNEEVEYNENLAIVIAAVVSFALLRLHAVKTMFIVAAVFDLFNIASAIAGDPSPYWDYSK